VKFQIVLQFFDFSHGLFKCRAFVVCKRLGNRFIGALHVKKVLERLKYYRKRRFIAQYFNFLGQMADGKVRGYGNDPAIGFLYAQNQTKQAGFTASVRADEPDPLLVGEGYGEVVEENLPSIALLDI